MVRTFGNRSALSLAHAASLAVWLGWGAVLVALLGHTSQSAAVAGRYSVAVALSLAVGGVGFVGLGVGLFVFWARWPAALSRRLHALPPAGLPVYLLAGAAALAWVQRLGLLWNALAGRPALPLGLAALYAGGGVLLYCAEATRPAPATAAAAHTASRRALAALLFALPVWLFAAAAGLRPDAGRGLLLLPGLLGVVLAVLALSSPRLAGALRSARAAVRAFRPGRWPLTAALLLLGYVALLYHPGLQHTFVQNDDLRLLWSVHAPAQFAQWAATHPYGLPLARPLFTLNAALQYPLFGLNYGGYYAVQMLTLALSGWLLFRLVWRATRSGPIGLAAAGLFVSHSYVSDLAAGWAFDTGPLTGVFVLLALGLVVRWRAQGRATLAVAALLVLTPISRENGLALPGATAFYGLVTWLTRWLPRRRAAGLLLLSVACVGGYFAWRTLAYPNWWQALSTLTESTDMFFTRYTREEVAALPPAMRWQLNAYTAAANLLSNIAPVIGPQGALWTEPLTPAAALVAGLFALVGALAARAALQSPAAHRAAPDTAPRALARLSLGLAALSLIFFGVAARPTGLLMPRLDLTVLQFALHAALSLGLGLALLAGRGWSRPRRALALLGLGLILANSLVTFPYFRYRSQYLAFIGWLLLLAVALSGLRGRPGRAHLRRALLVLVGALLVVNGLRVYTSLPLPHLLPANYTYTGLLCEPDFPADLSRALVARYHLDAQALQACRAAPP